MSRLRNFFFTNQNTKQTVIKNTVWIGASTIVMKVLRAAILIYAARLLGTEGYGVFSYAMSLAGIAAMFSDMGLSSLLTRELIQKKEGSKQYLSTSIAVKIIFILFVILLIGVIGPLVVQFPEAKTIMPVLAFSIGFESLRNFFYSISRAQNRMQTEAGIGFATELVCTVLVLGVFFKTPSAYTLALAYMIGNAWGLLITSVTLRRHIGFFWRYVKNDHIIPLMKATIPFAVMGIFGILMTNIDAVILGFFGNKEILGLYGAAQRPISVLYIIPGFLNVTLLPIMSRFAVDEKGDRLATITKKSLLISFGVALPIVLGGAIVAKPFINAAFGFSYVGAALTLQILLFSLLFSFPASIISDVLLAQDNKRTLVRASIAGALVNVVLDFIFIPQWGIAGSAIATVLAQCTAFFVLSFSAQAYVKGFLTKSRNIVTAAILMTIVVWWLVSLAVPLIAIVPIGGLIYIGTLFILKESLLKEFFSTFQRER